MDSEPLKAESLPGGSAPSVKAPGLTGMQTSPGRPNKKPLYLVMVLCCGALCLGAAISFLPAAWNPVRGNELRPEAKKPLIGEHGPTDDKNIILDSFVIPFEKHARLTFITLSIAFHLPSKELNGAAREKLPHLRYHIYETVREKMNKIGTIPPIETVKGDVLEVINKGLGKGKVQEVFILDYLAV